MLHKKADANGTVALTTRAKFILVIILLSLSFPPQIQPTRVRST